MNLREQAELDLATTLEDSVNGFGVDLIITDPNSVVAELCGQSGDVHFLVDPDTGQAVSGRVAHVAIRISSLKEKGLGIPQGSADKTGKPWRVAFKDLACNDQDFIILEARPDRTLGLVTCVVGVYKV